MNCEEANQSLDAYLDGELEPGKQRELEQHLNACPECRELLEQQRQFRAFFTANAPRYKAPSQLKARVIARVRTERSQPKLITFVRRPWLIGRAHV